MTTRRSSAHVSTIKRILKHEFGDDVLESENRTHFHRGNLLQVRNLSYIFHSKRTVTLFVCYITFMVSQLILSYIGLLYFEVENRPVIFVVYQIYCIISCYFFPLVISSAVDDSIERPFEDIAQELRACRVLAISIFAQGTGLILGIWATSAIFRGNVRFTLIDWDFTRNESTRIDVTNFLRFYQLLMLNLSVMTFIAAVSNWWTTKQRVERYFNRIGSTQEPLSMFMDEGNFYQDYLKTRRGSTYRITR